MKCPYYIKVCSKCKRILVANENNFRNKKTNGVYKLYSICKECEKKYTKKYREEHKEEIAEKSKQYYEENKEKNKEKKKEYDKKYYQENRDKRLEYQKEYNQEHKEEKKEYDKKYRQENPHKKFNNNQKRRQLEENQGRDITKEQWYEMMYWFDWCCAYSGEYIGGDNADKKRTTDHIIPISKGGLNEPWNCVPMLKSYNSSKHTNDMEEWYSQQPYFSEEKLQKIYAWCEYAWNKWKPRRKGNKKNS